MKCCVCNREREPAKIIDLTEEERQQLAQLTKKPLTEPLMYCKACWTVLSDRNQAAQLLRGMLQVSLSRAGVRDPNQVAKRYYNFILDRSTKKKTS